MGWRRRTCPEQFGAVTRRPEASGGCPNSETADADLNQIVGSFGVRSPLVSRKLLFPFGFAGPSALTRVLRRMEHRHVLQVRKPAYRAGPAEHQKHPYTFEKADSTNCHQYPRAWVCGTRCVYRK